MLSNFIQWFLILMMVVLFLLAIIFYIHGLIQKGENKEDKEKKSKLYKKANRFLLIFIIALITYTAIQVFTKEVFPAPNDLKS
jgi:hypothetical protein